MLSISERNHGRLSRIRQQGIISGHERAADRHHPVAGDAGQDPGTGQGLGGDQAGRDYSVVEVVLGELEMDDPVPGRAVVANDGLRPAAPIDVAEVRELGAHHAEVRTERM